MPKINELATIAAAGAKLVASDSSGDAGNVLASDFATASQGSLADTAVQPGDLATVATSGAYSDLSGTPTLGDLAAKDAVEIDDIDATGTPSSLTFLRGDGQWVAGGASGVATVTGDLVDNTDPANPVIKNPAVSDIDATGTADATTFLRGDGTWGTPSGSGLGDVVGPGSAIDNNIAVFDGATGKIIKDGGINSGTFATSAQGALANTAIQPGDLGTAAYSDTGDFATASQGSLADTAVQPGALGALAYEDDAAGVPYNNVTSGLVATDVQAAIDEIAGASGGGSAWEQIGSPVPATSGTSVSITSIPQTYDDLMIVFDGVSTTHSGNNSILVESSDDNGSTWRAGPGSGAPAGSVTTAQKASGLAFFYRYRESIGEFYGGAQSLAPGDGFSNAYQFGWYGTDNGSGVNALRFKINNGSFNGTGTLTLFGRKL